MATHIFSIIFTLWSWLWASPANEQELLRQKTVAHINNEMVLVAGGSFQMGCYDSIDSDCFETEKPVHEVAISDFYIGKYEVTQAQWVAIMGSNPSSFAGCDNCPVEQMNRGDVEVFLEKLNAGIPASEAFRLPTEAEWEYAARGGNVKTGNEKRTKYAGGNNLDSVGWYVRNSSERTHPVGMKAPNALGLFDMSGNVWEACGDWYDDLYYATSTPKNPQGPLFGSGFVCRGGSWSSDDRFCRMAYRYGAEIDETSYVVGLRLAKSKP